MKKKKKKKEMQIYIKIVDILNFQKYI